MFIYLFIKKNFFLDIYLFLRGRETEREQERGREREGDTESEAGSRLWAVSTESEAGIELMNQEIMTWAEVGCVINWLSHPGAAPRVI